MNGSGSFQAGSVIANKYAIERVLGEGGMGVVVAARHVQLQQRVAIKFLLPAMMAHPVAVSRFVREARACVRIQSEHVARVLDVGELDDGAPYMVMEYLEGTDLAQTLQAGRLPTELAVEYVLQACEALAEAHTLGIVHRDLKPANLFLTRRPDGSPFIKVLDFGISKSGGGTDGALTNTTAFLGSPLYSSPEQLLSSKSVDARTDIWALGVILYEACAGTTPFDGENVMEVASRVMQLTPEPLAALRPDLPRGFASVVMCCLEKNPANRFPDVGELARALGPFAPRAAISVERISGLLPRSYRPPPYLTEIGSAATMSGVGEPPNPATASTQNEWNQKIVRVDTVPAPSSQGGSLLIAAFGVSVVIAGVIVALRPSASTTTGGSSFPLSPVVTSAPSTPGASIPTVGPLPGNPPVSTASASSARPAAPPPPAQPRPRPPTSGTKSPLDMQLR